MRTALAGSLLVLLVLLVGAAGASSAPTRPHLRLVDDSPMTIVGMDFHARETIRVRFSAGAAGVFNRVAHATAGGSFRAAARIPEGACGNQLRLVRAVGEDGSIASLRFPPPQCPPDR